MTDTGAISNPLGVPVTLEDWEALLESVRSYAPEEWMAPARHSFGLAASIGPEALTELPAVREANREVSLMEATGRWRISARPFRQPSSFVPGDVLALRATATVHIALTGFKDGVVIARRDALPLASLVQSAQSYWLPASGVEAVLDSEPPPGLDDLVLPARASIVWFAEPVAPSALLRPLEIAELTKSMWVPGTGTLRVDEPWYPLAKADQALVRADANLDMARIEGVLLLADPNLRPTDAVAWMMATYEPDSPMPERTPVLARRSLAGWRPVLDMISAIVAWGDWHPPAERLELDEAPTREQLRRLRFGRTRRLEESGSLAGVEVLDTRRRAPAQASGGEDTHASPVTHFRRGHWQRYRHGPRDSWHYETHWIPPMVVNPTGPGDSRRRVYRLPPPG